MKAIWKETIIAESDKTIVVEGNHYFPSDSVNKKYLIESDTHTRCGWKGIANYYSVKIDDEINKDCAWYYPNPTNEAQSIKDYIAFWNGIKIIDNSM